MCYNHYGFSILSLIDTFSYRWFTMALHHHIHIKNFDNSDFYHYFYGTSAAAASVLNSNEQTTGEANAVATAYKMFLDTALQIMIMPDRYAQLWKIGVNDSQACVGIPLNLQERPLSSKELQQYVQSASFMQKRLTPYIPFKENIQETNLNSVFSRTKRFLKEQLKEDIVKKHNIDKHAVIADLSKMASDWHNQPMQLCINNQSNGQILLGGVCLDLNQVTKQKQVSPQELKSILNIVLEELSNEIHFADVANKQIAFIGQLAPIKKNELQMFDTNEVLQNVKHVKSICKKIDGKLNTKKIESKWQQCNTNSHAQQFSDNAIVVARELLIRLVWLAKDGCDVVLWHEEN